MVVMEGDEDEDHFFGSGVEGTEQFGGSEILSSSVPDPFSAANTKMHPTVYAAMKAMEMRESSARPPYTKTLRYLSKREK